MARAPLARWNRHTSATPPTTTRIRHQSDAATTRFGTGALCCCTGAVAGAFTEVAAANEEVAAAVTDDDDDDDDATDALALLGRAVVLIADLFAATYLTPTAALLPADGDTTCDVDMDKARSAAMRAPSVAMASCSSSTSSLHSRAKMKFNDAGIKRNVAHTFK